MNNLIFKKALKFVLKWEGGFSENKNDYGGRTNKGITQNTYNNWLKSHGRQFKDVRSITDAEVESIYFHRYWVASGCDKMSDKFAILAFDTAVNMGVSRVQEFLQAAKYVSTDKFILARAEKYNEFAKVASQRQFLHGWLNRLFDLKNYIEK